MGVIKLSPRLAEVLNAVRAGCGGKLTVEGFVAAMLVSLNEYAATDDELRRVGDLLVEKHINPQTLFQAAESAMNQNLSDTDAAGAFVKGAYIERKLIDAQRRTQPDGNGVVTIDLLLNVMLEQPNDRLIGILRQAVGDAKPAQETANSASAQTNVNNSDGPTVPSGVSDFFKKSFAGASSKPAAAPSASATATDAETKRQLDDLVKEIDRIRAELKENVKGQDFAIETFLVGYYQGEVARITGISKQGPRALFVFAGPPGVGKTMLAQAIAKAIGKAEKFHRLDMSDFSDKESSTKFIGSDNVYKDSQSGVFTAKLKEHPDGVFLFDEMEKAHMDTIHQFLPLLDAGHITDAKTREKLSCKDAIFIITTNAGKQLYEMETGDLSSIPRKQIIKALKEDISPITKEPFFPAAICSRMATGHVVMFNHMTAHVLQTISDNVLKKHCKQYEDGFGMSIDIGKEVSATLLFSEGASCDARTISARSKTFIDDEMYELLRLINSEKVNVSLSDVKRVHMDIDLSNASEQIRHMFVRTEQPGCLLVADADKIEEYRSKFKGVKLFTASNEEQVVELMKKNDFDFALIDIDCGMPAEAPQVLNVEDIQSEGRAVMKFLLSNYRSFPVYLLQEENRKIYNEEKISFMRQGIRKIIFIHELEDVIETVAEDLYQQSVMNQLERERKVISFETAQLITDDGADATILLFDLKMAMSVDSEDKDEILGSMSRPNVPFEKIIGSEDAKDELKLFVEYMRNPKKFVGSGMDVPKGILLYGPPGTGKTMLAKATATASDVTFIALEGNRFIKGFGGEGKDYLNRVFQTARKYAPAILFIDEIDVIAGDRSRGKNMHEDVLTAFLAQVDGFASDPSRPVFVLGATNYDVDPGAVNTLDQAFLRRFDNRIYVDLPNEKERLQFLKLKREEKKPLASLSDEKLISIAKRSFGQSCANLESVISFAMRMAVREGLTSVSDEMLDAAFEYFAYGEEKRMNEDQLERVIRHESGHALVCWLQGETPSYLTVVSRGEHGGYMGHDIDEGKGIFTKDELIGRVRVALAGRAAEVVCYGEKDGISTGASGDLQSATNTVYHMLCTYGMDEEYGMAALAYKAGEIPDSLRARINAILDREMKETIRMIEDNRAKLDAMTKELLAKNHLGQDDINRIFSEA